MPNLRKKTGILRNKDEIIPQTNSIITRVSISNMADIIRGKIRFSPFPILPLVSLFKHTHLSLRQALTEEFAFLLRGELQDTQITQRCIYGICIIHEVKITCYLDERQLDN